MNVIAIEKTCPSSPDQWEGKLENGLFFYARMRHKHLTVHIGTSIDDAIEFGFGDETAASEFAECLINQDYLDSDCFSTKHLIDVIGWNLTCCMCEHPGCQNSAKLQATLSSGNTTLNYACRQEHLNRKVNDSWKVTEI